MLEKIIFFLYHLRGYSSPKQYLLLSEEEKFPVNIFFLEKNSKKIAIIIAKKYESVSSVTLRNEEIQIFIRKIIDMQRFLSRRKPVAADGADFRARDFSLRILNDSKRFMSVEIGELDENIARLIFGYGAESQIFMKIPTLQLRIQIENFLSQIGELP